jgi:hypothetical protein
MSLFDQFFVYHPEPWQDRDWARLTGLPLEEVWFQAADGARLFGWYVEVQADRPVILWCHGNAGRIINRLEACASSIGSNCPSSSSTIRAMGGVGKAIRRRLRTGVRSLAHFN